LFLPHQAPFLTGNSPLGASESHFFERYPPLFEIRQSPVNKRPFGTTGITVSEIGLGAWELANPDWGVSDTNEALQIVYKSLDAGCDFFDTAPPTTTGKAKSCSGKR
jgi:hypothetical protein